MSSRKRWVHEASIFYFLFLFSNVVITFAHSMQCRHRWFFFLFLKGFLTYFFCQFLFLPSHFLVIHNFSFQWIFHPTGLDHHSAVICLDVGPVVPGTFGFLQHEHVCPCLISFLLAVPRFDRQTPKKRTWDSGILVWQGSWYGWDFIFLVVVNQNYAVIHNLCLGERKIEYPIDGKNTNLTVHHEV